MVKFLKNNIVHSGVKLNLQKDRNGLKNKLGNMKAEQENVASSTRQLETLFRATGKSVDDFAGALGNRLVNAIRNGTATSRQLEQALGIIGREALGAETDIEKLQRALRSWMLETPYGKYKMS